LWSVSSFSQLNPDGPFIHSHNDYAQKKPLISALDAGAKSIEIDVFLHHHELVVAHSKSEIEIDNTIENLYIQPLKKYLSETKDVQKFHFLIDIKSEATSTLAEIEKTLKKYPSLFSQKGIQVIISGNRPNAEDYSNYANFIWFDGREAKDAKGPNGDRIGMISQNLSKFTRWRGDGEISAKEKSELEEFINKCHKQNIHVRLWNTGDTKKIYELLYALGVDYINTDNPAMLKKFLSKI